MVVALANDVAQQISTDMQQHHIPAWKRLGLKLKFAKESNDRSAYGNGSVSSSTKRLRFGNGASEGLPNGTNSEGPLTKKRRTGSSQSPPPQLNRNSTESLTPSIRRGSLTAKKKVSFTPETKVEDGDSSRTLIAAWEADYDQYEREFADHLYNTSPSHIAPEDHSSVPGEQFKKREHKQDKRAGTPHKSRDALQYLTQYHTARDTWKFNKNREVWLLKHILSTNDIPPSYNQALACYIHGLKSSGARSRLLAQCRETLTEDEDTSHDADQTSARDRAEMEDIERRQRYHEIAKRRFERSLEEHLDRDFEAQELEDPGYQQWLARRKRAELLLWAVEPGSMTSKDSMRTSGGKAFVVSSPVNDKMTNGISSYGLQKKKKNRTAVVDVATSSSEDEDETVGSDTDTGSQKKRNSTTTDDESDRGKTTDTTSSDGSASSGSSHESSNDLDGAISSSEDDSDASSSQSGLHTQPRLESAISTSCYSRRSRSITSTSVETANSVTTSRSLNSNRNAGSDSESSSDHSSSAGPNSEADGESVSESDNSSDNQ